MLGGEIVDIGQDNELVDRKFVFFPFQAVQPAGRYLVGLVALLLGKAETPFFHLAQRELPLPSNCTKPKPIPAMEQTFLAIHVADSRAPMRRISEGDRFKPIMRRARVMVTACTLQLKKQLRFYPLSRNGRLTGGIGALTQVKV